MPPCATRTGQQITNDRVGGARNDDRQAGKGPASPSDRPRSPSRTPEDGCGNDVPMETTERFPQGLGNLAQHARFPHSHSRSFVGLKREKNRRTRAQTATSINNRPSRSPRPWWPVLKCRSVAGFQVSTEGCQRQDSADRYSDGGGVAG